MEWPYHPHSKLDKMDVEKEEDDTEGEEGANDRGGKTNGEGMEGETADDDASVELSDETHKGLKISTGPSYTCRTVRVRPKLLTTKSFPPYNQHMGGLGDDEGDSEWENETPSPTEDGRLDSEPRVSPKPILRLQERKREGRSDEPRVEQRRSSADWKSDTGMTARWARSELKAKWRGMRREEGDSGEAEVAGWERRQRWNVKRRMGESGGEREHETKDGGGRGEGVDGEGRHGRDAEGGASTNAEIKGAEEEVRHSDANPGVEGESERSGKMERESEEDEWPAGKRGSSTNHGSTPHPFSRLLNFSSASSSSSSFNVSSAESDDVFSEGDDAASKRKTFRKCRSWKSFLTMMHWSLGRQSCWVQLAGHQGNFQLSEGGEVLKLYSEVEALCLDSLMKDPLRPFVPQYHGLVTREQQRYIRLEDLLSGLKNPVIMDCKMGVRTYQEEELVKARAKTTLRSDMYQKMVKVDPMAPSAEEHAQKGVSKCRYLQWRDTTSSTSTLGFRIEGLMMDNGTIKRDFRKVLTLAQVTEALLYFTNSQLHILKAYHTRLQALSDALKRSPFFKSHEVIGSSLLFAHDNRSKANVWMIDFGKTTPVPNTSELKHDVPWAEGSREDGYLIGLASLDSSLSQAITLASWQQENS